MYLVPKVDWMFPSQAENCYLCLDPDHLLTAVEPENVNILETGIYNPQTEHLPGLGQHPR